jgi:hypothetical protein
MTKVIDTHYKYYPPYMIRLTITVPLQPRTPFFMWKILLLELSAYTITYICAQHTCEFTHQPQPLCYATVTDRMHLLTCTYHTYQIVCSPGTNQSMWQNGGLRSVDKVANELWALTLSHGCRLLVFGVSLQPQQLDDLRSTTQSSDPWSHLQFSFNRRGWTAKLNPEKPRLTWIIFKDAVRVAHYTHNTTVITPVNYV